MVQLLFNLPGYSYQEGIKIVRQSYQSAEQALYTEIENAKAEAIAYEESRAQGGPFIGEMDDGHVVWSQDQVLDLRYRATVEALDSLRRSYAISIYHLWERGARIWGGGKRGDDHDRLVKKVSARGLTIDPRLAILRIVANLLKHDNDYWGNQLVAAAPDLLDLAHVTPPRRTDWYEAVIIPHQWMPGFFDAVAASGPNIKTVFPK